MSIARRVFDLVTFFDLRGTETWEPNHTEVFSNTSRFFRRRFELTLSYSCQISICYLPPKSNFNATPVEPSEADKRLVENDILEVLVDIILHFIGRQKCSFATLVAPMHIRIH